MESLSGQGLERKRARVSNGGGGTERKGEDGTFQSCRGELEVPT